MNYSISREATLTEEEKRLLPDSLQQPAWHVIVLGIFTFGLYLVYWAYKTWRDLKRAASLGAGGTPALPRLNPAVAALFALIPLVNVCLFGVLAMAIAELVPSQDSFARKYPLLAAFAVIGSYIALSLFGHLHTAWYMVSLLASAPFAVLQHWLNQYWESVESTDLMVRNAFTLKEMVVIVLGGLLLGLVASGLIMGVKL